MSGSKGLPASRIVLLDRHVRIAETDNLHLAASLDIDGGLLRSARSAERPVKRDFSSVLGSHISCSCSPCCTCGDNSWTHAYRRSCRAWPFQSSSSCSQRYGVQRLRLYLCSWFKRFSWVLLNCQHPTCCQVG